MSTPEKNEPYRQGAPGRTSWAIATPLRASAICSDSPAASDTGAVAPASMNGVIATGCAGRRPRHQALDHQRVPDERAVRVDDADDRGRGGDRVAAAAGDRRELHRVLRLLARRAVADVRLVRPAQAGVVEVEVAARLGDLGRLGDAAPWPALLLLGLLGACQQAEAPPPDIRPVKTVTVERRASGAPVSLTGQIRAQDEASLAFRIDGRMLERRVNVGDRVKAGQLVARLDPLIQQNAFRSAQANLSAAQGQLTQARNTFERQQALVEKGFTTRVQFDQAQQGLQTAQAHVDSAQAQLRNAQEQLSYTDLYADADGTVTDKGAEPGEVVRAGRMIVQVARQGGRDAVFDVSPQIKDGAPRQS